MTNEEIIEKLKTINVYKTRLMIFLKNHQPDIYAAILKNTNFLDIDNKNNRKIPFAERLYCIKNNIAETPKCPICGRFLKFNTDISQYYKTCSISCSRKTEETMRKFHDSLAKKEDPMNIKKARETRYIKNNGKWHADDFYEKAQQTLIEEHGDPHWNNPEQFKKTSLERYDIDHPMKCEDVREIQRKRVTEIYGVDCVFKLDRIRENTYLGIRKRAWQQLLRSTVVSPMISEDDFLKIKNINDDECIEFKCLNCGKTFYGYWDNGHTRPCPHCSAFGHGTSDQEKQLFEFIKSILKNNHKAYTREKINRSIISPKEIDVIITDNFDKIVLGIEFDGLYWHSEDVKGKKNCLEKTTLCENQNIHLIHIFENEWLTKQEIVKSRLKNTLGIFDKTIYARKCLIKTVNTCDSIEFQNKNHIQGYANASVNLGLYDNNELVALMTFGKCRFDKKHEWEMLRFCTKLGYHIPGAAGKLLKYFERNYNPKSIVSYADRRWSQGKLYNALGFTLDHISSPNYWYFKNNDTRYVYTRINFQKHKLKSKLKTFDQNKSEVENMKINGYSRIFDCGNLVFEKIYIN